MGQEELRALQSEMDGILKKQGLTQGTVGERMTALGKEPRYQFRGQRCRSRAKLMAYPRTSASRDMRTRLPRAFATLVPGNLEIKRMPPEVEPGAPGAYGGAGTIDGKVPGKFWINLHTMSSWTTYNLPTLAYHESIPGHVWQGEYTFKLPLFRSLLAFNAYSEGWALYAEQLADELGVYDNDPIGRLGYLQSIAFRACRLVVDTGLHAKRWTRQQAIQWFATTNGSSVDEVTSEVDRYCAWPGQACGYKVGHSEINRLRTKAQTGARREVRSAQVQRRRREGRRRADGRAGAQHRCVHRAAEVASIASRSAARRNGICIALFHDVHRDVRWCPDHRVGSRCRDRGRSERSASVSAPRQGDCDTPDPGSAACAFRAHVPG